MLQKISTPAILKRLTIALGIVMLTAATLWAAKAMPELVQILNVISLSSILVSILISFTDKTLIICAIFRRWGVHRLELKSYFILGAIYTIVRLAAYIWDFKANGSPPYAVYLNAWIAFGLCYMTVMIYRRRREIDKRVQSRKKSSCEVR